MFIIISSLLFSTIFCKLNSAVKNEDYFHKSSFSIPPHSSLSLNSTSSSSPSSFSSLLSSLSSSISLLSKSNKKNLNKRSFNLKIDKIYRLLNSDHPPRKARHLSAPSYMIHLYKSLSNTNTGESISAKPYNATIIRSFQRSEYGNDMQFHFNISTNLLLNEKLLGSEFRIFKLKPKLKYGYNFPKSHLFEVKIFQILSNNSNERRLLDSRRMSLNSVGWEVFYVKQALIDWIKDNKTNYGFVLTVNTLLHEAIETPIFRWIKTHHHQINRRPVLIVFTANNESQQFNEKIGGNKNDVVMMRNVNDKKSPLQSFIMDASCNKHDHFISLHHLNISEWIIYPKSFNSYSCYGSCSNYNFIKSKAMIKVTSDEKTMKNNQKENKNYQKTNGLQLTTSYYNNYCHNNKNNHYHDKNHFTAFDSYHQKPNNHKNWKPNYYIKHENENINNDMQTLEINHCFPLAFSSLDLLYFDRFGDAVLRQIPDMIIKECGCV